MRELDTCHSPGSPALTSHGRSSVAGMTSLGSGMGASLPGGTQGGGATQPPASPGEAKHFTTIFLAWPLEVPLFLPLPQTQSSGTSVGSLRRPHSLFS